MYIWILFIFFGITFSKMMTSISYINVSLCYLSLNIMHWDIILNMDTIVFEIYTHFRLVINFETFCILINCIAWIFITVPMILLLNFFECDVHLFCWILGVYNMILLKLSIQTEFVFIWIPIIFNLLPVLFSTFHSYNSQNMQPWILMKLSDAYIFA